MSKQFAFALCVTTILGGTESVYAETPKLLEEGGDGKHKHIVVKKKKGKPFSFKRKGKGIPQVSAIKTRKEALQERKRSKKPFFFKRKSLNRAPHVAVAEKGKVNLQGRKRARKPFSFFFKRKHQVTAAEADKVNLQVRKKPRRFFSFTRKSLNKRPQVATIPLASAIRPVRNGHLVLKSLTSKTPLSQYREERKIIRAHPSVQNIIFFPRTEGDTSAVKQIVRGESSISQVMTPIAKVRVSNNAAMNREGQAAISESAATHVAAPTAEIRASNNEVENEIVLQPAVSELVAAHVSSTTTEVEVANDLEERETVVSKASELVSTHTNTATEVSAANGSNEGETVLSEPSDLLSTHIADSVKEAFGLNSSNDAAAHEEEQPASELVASHTDAPGEEFDSANDLGGREAVLSELSDLLSTHVVDPMKEILGLNSSNDIATNGERQEQDLAPANNGGENAAAEIIPEAAVEQDLAPANNGGENAAAEIIPEAAVEQDLAPANNGGDNAAAEIIPEAAVEQDLAPANNGGDNAAAEIIPEAAVEQDLAPANNGGDNAAAEIIPEAAVEQDLAPANNGGYNAAAEIIPEAAVEQDLAPANNGGYNAAAEIIPEAAVEQDLAPANNGGDNAAAEIIPEAAVEQDLAPANNGGYNAAAEIIPEAAVEQDLAPANNGGDNAAAEIIPEAAVEQDLAPANNGGYNAAAEIIPEAAVEQDLAPANNGGYNAAAEIIPEAAVEQDLAPANNGGDNAAAEIIPEAAVEQDLAPANNGGDNAAAEIIPEAAVEQDLAPANNGGYNAAAEVIPEAAVEQDLAPANNGGDNAAAEIIPEAAVEQDLAPANNGGYNAAAEVIPEAAVEQDLAPANNGGYNAAAEIIPEAAVEQDLAPANNGGYNAAAEVIPEAAVEQDLAPANNGGENTVARAEPDLAHVTIPEKEVAPTGESDASDGEEDLGLSSIFTDHTEDFESENLELTADASDGMDSPEKSTDISLDDALLSLYSNDEEPVPFKSHEDSLYQLSSLLSGKEPTHFENPFLQESEGFTPDSDLLEIQKKIRGLSHATSVTLFSEMSEREFESERQKLQDSQRKAVDLAAKLSEVAANKDGSLLSQIEQVRKTLQDKAQQLLDWQARMDYVSQKREQAQKPSSDQSVDYFALYSENGDLSTSISQGEEDALSLTTGYSHIDMTPQQSLYQLSSLLSGKEPTSSAVNPFLQEIEGFVPDLVLLTIQNEIFSIMPDSNTAYSLMSADEFEEALVALQNSQRKAVGLAIRLNEEENQANGDQNLLGQIEQVRKTLQDKAQQLLDLKERMDYVSQKREEEQKRSSDQIKASIEAGGTYGTPTTSQDGSNGLSITTGYYMRDMNPLESFYQLSSILSGKTSEPLYGSVLLQQGASNPTLFDIQQRIGEINPKVKFGDLYHQMSSSEFEDARQNLESLQGKAASLVVALNEMGEQADGDGGLLSQIEQVRKTLQDKAQQLLDVKIRVDHVSKKRLEEQNLSSGQIEGSPVETATDVTTSHGTFISSAALISEGSIGETGMDRMTRQYPSIPSAALPLLKTVADDTTSLSTPIPSLGSEEISKFGKFSTHLTTLTSLFGENSAKLGMLTEDQKGSNKGKFIARLVKLLQNNFYDQAQTLGFSTSFEKFEEERTLSYDEALAALPQLLQFASSIQAETVINLTNPIVWMQFLNSSLGDFVKKS